MEESFDEGHTKDKELSGKGNLGKPIETVDSVIEKPQGHLETAEVPVVLEKDKASPEILLKLHEQYCHNARAYMDLRFKHFTTFMFLTGLLGAVTFQVEPLKSFRPVFCLAAAAFTILFWLLDYRTGYHQKAELTRIQYYERLLGAPVVNTTPQRFGVKASLTTNIIFMLLLLSWGYMAWTQERRPPTTTTVENAPSEDKKQGSPTETGAPPGEDKKQGSPTETGAPPDKK